MNQLPNLSTPVAAAAVDVAAIRLNVGCGLQRPDGWLNTDSSLASFVQRLPLVRRIFGARFNISYERPARWLDLRRRWPLADGSCAVVYASHVFEHLSRDQATHFLAEAQRVLAAGGAIRIVVPDLLALARTYLDEAASGDAGASRRFLHWVNLHQDGTYPRSAGVLKRTVALWQGHPHQHKYMYDLYSLSDVLSASGFVDLASAAHGRSARVDDIDLLEPPGSGVDSIYIEGRKADG